LYSVDLKQKILLSINDNHLVCLTTKKLIAPCYCAAKYFVVFTIFKHKLIAIILKKITGNYEGKKLTET